MSEASRAQAIEQGRQRRAGAAISARVRVQSFVREMNERMDLSMRKRIRVATEYLKSRVIVNISRAVVKQVGARGRIVVTERSRKGEYPRADTTQLMKTIASGVQEEEGRVIGWVGTPLDYGAILELSPDLDRRFLTRTLEEERGTIMDMINSPGGMVAVEEVRP